MSLVRATGYTVSFVTSSSSAVHHRKYALNSCSRAVKPEILGVNGSTKIAKYVSLPAYRVPSGAVQSPAERAIGPSSRERSTASPVSSSNSRSAASIGVSSSVAPPPGGTQIRSPVSGTTTPIMSMRPFGSRTRTRLVGRSTGRLAGVSLATIGQPVPNQAERDTQHQQCKARQRGDPPGLQ